MIKRVVKYLSLGFIIGFIPVFLLVSLVVELKLGLILGSIVGIICSLFSLGFMKRTLKRVEFEVNMQNKDPEKGMAWYEQRVREQINNMGFEFKSKQAEVEVFKPRALYKLYEPDIELEVNTYFINIKASRLMVRLISSYVEILA